MNGHSVQRLKRFAPGFLFLAAALFPEHACAQKPAVQPQQHATASPEAAPAEAKGPDQNEALELIVETLEALTEERGETEPIWGSMIKQAIKRRQPGFNERFYGFRSFNDLLADGEKRGLLELRPDEKSGGYILRLLPH